MNNLTQGSNRTTLAGPFGLPPGLGSYRGEKRHPFWLLHEKFRRAHIDPVNIQILGDSISEGAFASSGSNRWVWKFRDAVRAQFQPSGIAGGDGWIRTANDQPAMSAYVSYSGGVADPGEYGPIHFARRFSTTGDSITLTVSGTDFDLTWLQAGGGGVFSYTVDGGAATNVDTNGFPTTDARSTPIRGLSAGSHTIVIAWVSGILWYTGIICYNGDLSAGIRVHETAMSGHTIASYQGIATGYGINYTPLLFKPDLFILMIGVNDARNYSTAVNLPEGFERNLRSVIAAYTATVASREPAWLLVNCFKPTGVVDAYNWNRYRQALQRVAAATERCQFVDVWAAMGSPEPNVNPWLDTDQIHPTDAGHAFIAQVVADAVLPSTITRRSNKL